jgi:hypothetical protein
MKKYFFFLSFISAILFSDKSFSQGIDSTAKLSFSGYVDAYYAVYSDNVGKNQVQKFPTVSPRSNQFGLNVAMLTAKYGGDKIRSTITLHMGDIPRTTWSGNYPYLQEANAGIRLSKKVWLDAGLFRTHFGTECLMPKENYTSSVAVATYYEPYYEAGVKLNYNPTEKLSFNFFAFNGYGIYDDNNGMKSVGMLATYVFNDKWNIGYSNYVGDDSPDSSKATYMRSFHNVFINYHYKKFKFTTGADLNFQQHSKLTNSKQSAIMWTALAIADYQIAKRTDVYSRAEIINDAHGIMTGVWIDKKGKVTGLKLWGITLGMQYKPTENSYIKLEGRLLQANSNQEIFFTNQKFVNYRWETMMNMGVWF